MAKRSPGSLEQRAWTVERCIRAGWTPVSGCFSYGTLQLEEVQLSQFGCRLSGEADAVIGYRREMIEVDDPETLALSGERFHAIVVETGEPTDEVDGTLFLVTDAQLAAADHYEVAAYRRAEVRLRSGRTAWAYVKA